MMASPDVLRDERIHAETLRMFDEAQQAAEDELPLYPNERQLEGASPDFCQAILAMHEISEAARAKVRRCPVCGGKIEREDGAEGRPRIYDRNACKFKAFRLRRLRGT